VFSRYVSRPYAVGPPPAKPRMLCVIAAPIDAHRYRLAPIDYDVTRRRLVDCLADLRRDLEIEFLDRPVTAEKLRDRLRNGGFHLLHLHGHGTIPRHGESVLVLEDGDHKVRFATESALRSILLGLRDLKLVTLVACHGGEPSAKDDHLSGLAGSLVRRNVPAVIAMRRAISMKLGADFTRSLYRQLAKEPCIDAAVNEARHRLYMENPKGVEWSSPVLYMRLTDGLLWSSEKAISEDSGPVGQALGAPRRPILLFVILLLTLVFSFLSGFVGRWVEPIEVVAYPGPEPSAIGSGTVGQGQASVPPPQSSISYEPFVAGKVGVGAISRETLEWQGDIARILYRQLSNQNREVTAVVVPEALHSKLGRLFEGDLSPLKGGDRTPYGLEYLLIAAESHGDLATRRTPFPTVQVTCEMVLVELRQPAIRFNRVFTHTGQDTSRGGALEQAFERCVESSVEHFP